MSEAVVVSDGVLRLVFADGLTGEVVLDGMRGPAFIEARTAEGFAKARVDRKTGTVTMRATSLGRYAPGSDVKPRGC